MLAHQTILNHDYFLKLIISLQVWLADCGIGKQQVRIIIIIFIQEFGTLLHKIRHETIKIKHNT